MVDKKKYIGIGAVAVVVFLIIYYWTAVSDALALGIAAAMPLLVGVVMAYVINILMCFYEKFYFKNAKKNWINQSRRSVCIVLSLVTVVAILAVVIGIVVPEFISGIELLVKEVPGVLNKAYLWLIHNEDIKPFLDPEVLNTQIDWQKMIKDIIDFVVTGAGGVMNSAFSIASSLFSFAAQGLIGFIFAMYLLLNKEKVIGQFNKLFHVYLKDSIREKMEYFFVVANETFKSYIVGQCTEAVILGVLCAVGMLIFGFPYAGMTGAVIGVTALIPVAGAYIGAGVGAFMICTVSPLKAVLFIVYIVVLQQLEGNLIYPKVVGSSIGLPGMWVLAAVTVGGGIMGIPGMLFGVPLAATLYKLLRADVNHKLKNTAAKNVAE